MRNIQATGEQVCETRAELAKKYFTFESSIKQYSEGNLGIVSLLSDVQEALAMSNAPCKEENRQILNDIKCILIADTKE